MEQNQETNNNKRFSYQNLGESDYNERQQRQIDGFFEKVSNYTKHLSNAIQYERETKVSILNKSWFKLELICTWLKHGKLIKDHPQFIGKNQVDDIILKRQDQEVVFGSEISRCYSLKSSGNKVLADVFLNVNHPITGDLQIKGQILPKGTCKSAFQDQTFNQFSELVKSKEPSQFSLPFTKQIDDKNNAKEHLQYLVEYNKTFGNNTSISYYDQLKDQYSHFTRLMRYYGHLQYDQGVLMQKKGNEPPVNRKNYFERAEALNLQRLKLENSQLVDDFAQIIPQLQFTIKNQVYPIFGQLYKI